MDQRDLTFCQSRGGTHRLDWCVVHDSEWPMARASCDKSPLRQPRRNHRLAAIDALRERSGA